MNNKVIQGDNLEFMRTCKDNQFDLGIVDPPYGIGESSNNNNGRSKLAISKDYGNKDWDNKPPTKEYFDELIRITKNQIIWGANHFIDLIPYRSSCWVVWDKVNGQNDFADCELAWSSFKTAVRRIEFKWHGMLQGNMKNKEVRIHPTQKPVALYKWLLKNYAKPGDTIFDSHVGSGSIRIACHDMGFDFTGCEIDEDYYRDQETRFKNHTRQGDLFSGQELQNNIYHGDYYSS